MGANNGTSGNKEENTSQNMGTQAPRRKFSKFELQFSKMNTIAQQIDSILESQGEASQAKKFYDLYNGFKNSMANADAAVQKLMQKERTSSLPSNLMKSPSVVDNNVFNEIYKEIKSSIDGQFGPESQKRNNISGYNLLWNPIISIPRILNKDVGDEALPGPDCQIAEFFDAQSRAYLLKLLSKHMKDYQASPIVL